MSNKLTLKNTFIEIICIGFSLLFIYAAISKLLDYENFGRQLGQSPMLSAFAPVLRWVVPAVELVISIGLFLPRLRFVALLLSYSLMVMFTAYIYILLHYSSFVPCSCGGILEKLSWNEHLLFNLLFIALGAVAVLVFPDKNVQQTKGLQS